MLLENTLVRHQLQCHSQTKVYTESYISRVVVRLFNKNTYETQIIMFK